MLDHNSTIPLYMQIANWIETEILKGNFKVDEKVYSQYQLADMFHINPATAARGLTILNEQEILYNRRGLGKFVTQEAISIIKMKRKDEIVASLIETLVKEAAYLDIDEDTLIQMVIASYKRTKGGSAHDSL